ncbi:MAG: PEP-CTERM sorting domain-containing protein [Verrucomicrobiaceae bacterium]|nr:MAG: PEP-CTERM sorting domain-containing protein [Verrucomicrobiaceae bacterium]
MLRSMSLKSKLLLGPLLLGSSLAVQAAVSLDFNTSGQFAENFSTFQTEGLIAQAPGGGLGNSGHVNLGIITAAQIWTFNTAFRGDLTSWSAEFYLKGTYFKQFGFTSDATPRQIEGMPVNSAETAYQAHIALGSGNGTGDGDAIGLYKDGAVAASSLISVPLTDSWYRYKISVDYLGSDNFDVTGTIHTADASGALLTEIGFIRSTINNPGLASANQAHLYFGFNYPGESVDNFSTTIPEPSVLGLVALSLGFSFRRRR